MHANGAVHRVVEQQDNRPDPLADGCRQLLPSHHKAAITAKSDDDAAGISELRGDGRRHAIAHRAAGRTELPPRPAVLQKAVWPAAEIAGIRGDDRVLRQTLAQPSHDLLAIEHRRLDKSGVIYTLL